jgi:hypothetical protein
MNEPNRYIKLFIVLVPLLAIFISPQPLYANPIDPDFPFKVGPMGLIPVLWTLSSIIEALLIVFILRRRFANFRARIRPFLFIVLLNFVTILITQILGTLLFQVNKGLFYLAELFPLIIEFLVLKWLFSYLHRRGNISETVTTGFTLFLTVVANALTFGLGFLFFHYFPSIYNPPFYFL